METTTETRYDAIVIGSGIGGLTVASLLAQIHQMRVLVLERHFTFGGFTHEFSRGKHGRWDVGLHYVGGMEQGSQARSIMDLVTQRGVQWQQMLSPFEKFVYPDFTLSVPTNPNEYRTALINQFPHEEQAIERYFKDIDHAGAWIMRYFLQRFGFPLDVLAHPAMKFLNDHTAKIALSTTGAYLRAHIADKRLRGVLVSQWGDYGLPPAKSAFAIHAMIVSHFLNGAAYPVGGAGTIGETVKRVLSEHGGECLTNHQVTEIIVENNAVQGVKVVVQKGHGTAKTEEHLEFSAPLVISDAGAATTFLHLLPPTVNLPFRHEVEAIPNGHEVATVYIGFKDNPSVLGVHGENYWLYDSYDHDEMYARRNAVLDGKPSSCYLSFPSLKDAAATAHTAEILLPLDFSVVEEWHNTEWKRRGKDYNDLKKHIAEAMIAFVNKRLPGFAGLVDFYEVSTPLTVQQFTGHKRGSIYGVPATPERFGYDWLRPETPVQGLYLTGCDVSSLGIVGAMQGGVATASTILKGGMVAVMTAVKKYEAHNKERE
jgi:phytoene dehydrogenase-like protein